MYLYPKELIAAEETMQELSNLFPWTQFYTAKGMLL